MSKTSEPVTEQMPDGVAPAFGQSFIGKTLRIKGELSGAEPIHIAGCVQGSINDAGHLVTVAADGDVKAQIVVGSLTVVGKVLGNVKAEDRLEIRAGGSVVGEVTVQRIRVEEGALLQGRVHLEEKTKGSSHVPAKA